MPRTWSYRKRDYEIVRPDVKKLPRDVIVLMFLYGLMLSALIIGIGYTMTHKLAALDQGALLAPAPHKAASYQEPKDD